MPRIPYLELVLYKTYADLKAEASRTYLSFLWWVIEPVLYMIVFYVVFDLLFKRGGGGDFIPFLLCGLTVWKWFDGTLRGGMVALRSNISLMRQVHIPKILFPTVTILNNTVKFAIVQLLLLIFLQLYGFTPTWVYLALPLLILVQLCLIAACTYWLAAVEPFLPDIKPIVANVLTLMLFLSGIFYSPDRIPEAYRAYFFLNPMAGLIDAYRDVLLEGVWPNWSRVLWVAVASAGALYTGILFLKAKDRVYPRILI
jgi:lipopolysaccharide transport system permease protein